MTPGCNLAIETSAREGRVTLGRGATMLETAALPKRRRHNIELMPMIDALCQRHGVEKAAIEEVYVSLGPGSFTGLRIALATVKMLAMTLGVRVVGVPSVEVVAQNAPSSADHVAVCLNLKRGTMHSQVFERRGEALAAISDARLRTIDELLEAAPRPVMLIGEMLPELPASAAHDAAVTVLGPAQAAPRSEVVWQLGRQRAEAGQFDDPLALSPLYVREPEAVTLWRAKQSASD